MPYREERTILFGDIRDFTSLTASEGDREAYRLSKTFVNLVEEQVRKNEGEVVKTYGDGVMTTFPEGGQGLRAATGMQQALKEYNERNSKKNISAGIGLNRGGTIREENDIFGHAVNLTARLANQANGGQILISSYLRDSVADREEYEFVDLGYREIKGIGKENLYELLWRDEVGRLSTRGNELILVLTEDYLAIELSKDLQQELQQARKELTQEAKDKTGLAKFILEKVEGYLDKYLSRFIGWALARRGVGLEHPLENVKLKLTGGELSIFTDGDKLLSLGPEEIEPEDARSFVNRFRKLKSSRGERN